MRRQPPLSPLERKLLVTTVRRDPLANLREAPSPGAIFKWEAWTAEVLKMANEPSSPNQPMFLKTMSSGSERAQRPPPALGMDSGQGWLGPAAPRSQTWAPVTAPFQP